MVSRQLWPGVTDFRCVVGAPAVELGGIGTLEGVDRLFAVAHGEDGTWERFLFAGAGAGEELAGQVVGNFPLKRRGILHFVQEKVVQATVELEEDPGGAAGIGEQGVGAADEFVVVEEAASFACFPCAGEDRAGDG